MDDKNRTGWGALRLPEDDPGQGPALALLGFLIAHHPGLYSGDELVRKFTASDQDQAQQRFELQEGIQQLVEDGLAHRLGDFVWASHAAVSGERRLRA